MKYKSLKDLSDVNAGAIFTKKYNELNFYLYKDLRGEDMYNYLKFQKDAQV